MKTIKALLMISLFTLIGCSTDSPAAAEELDCNCGVITEKIVFNLPTSSFTKLTLKNNCTDEVSFITVNGNQGAVGEQWCNN